MKKLLIPFLLFSTLSLFAQPEKYSVLVNLNDVQDDKIRVTITVPSVDQNEIEYHMPKVVPGTYSISDFGRFITEFEAKDAEGNNLEVEKLTTNRWKIKEATRLATITYLADDSFDKTEGYKSNYIFEPGGTNIEARRDVFVLNTFGIIGYLQGKIFHPFEVTISHPSHIYGATSLKRVSSTDESDTFTADNYNFLADAPIMYSVPDTVTKNIAGAEIIVSVFSPNGKLSAREVMDNIDDLMEAQSKYLGGKLPVDRYAYLIYLMDYNSLSGAMGALEHSYSSLYTLPEIDAKSISKSVRDVAAHEFLHIVTPLNIHSEEIHNFNYIEPEMSRHLWLYEGVTEYSAMHVQVRNSLYDVNTFLDEVRQKMQVADQFPEVSFTEMSEKILEPNFEPMFTNVYYKGALIGMCLDLHLIKYSNGDMDLRKLMSTLSEKYGPAKAFKDEELFDEITAITSPEVGNFFSEYVDGDKPLPLEKCLSWAGINYQAEEKVSVTTMGNIGLTLGEDQSIMVSGIQNMNEFGKEMGYQEGDIIQEINGVPVSLENFQVVFEDIKYNLQEGKKLKMTVLRDLDGEKKSVKLKAKAQKISSVDRHKLSIEENPTEDQLRIRELWLSDG